MLYATFTLGAILACGGCGGGGSSAPSGPPQNPAGLWAGQYTNETGVNKGSYPGFAAATQNGAIFCAINYNPQAPTGTAGGGANVWSDQLKIDSSYFTGSGTIYYEVYTTTNYWDGSITEGSAIASTWSDPDGDSGRVDMSFDALYNRPVAMSSLAGTYTVSSAFRNIGTSVVFQTNGTFASGVISGTITQVAPTANLFNVAMNFSGDSTDYTGFAWWSDGQSANFVANSLYLVWAGGASWGVATLSNSAVGSLEIHNESGQNITGIWIAPHPETAWGSNLLTGTIADGSSLSFANISPGSFDGQVQLADATYQQDIDVQVAAGTTTTFIVSK
jgi:hypothetical protein